MQPKKIRENSCQLSLIVAQQALKQTAKDTMLRMKTWNILCRSPLGNGYCNFILYNFPEFSIAYKIASLKR
jgi:hypothetical protein